MTQIGVFPVTSPMKSANYRKGNLLSPPHLSYLALRSHSNTINPRSSTPSATIISQAKPQPSFGREMLSERKPTSGNLRPAQDDVQDDVPTIRKINKALAIIAKSGKYGKALSHFIELQLKEIELDLYTFSIAIKCYCHLNRVGFGLSLLGGIFKRGYTPDVITVTPLLNGLIAQDTADEALSLFNKLQLRDIDLDLQTFTIAIKCYCHLNRVGFGLSLLGGIFKRGYTPGVVTFTTLLNGLIAQDKADEALSLFNKLQLRDIDLDLHTFNIAIYCYSRVNRVGFGFSLLGSIFKRGYTPNEAAFFNTLLKGLVTQDKADEALSLFNKLQLQDIELDLYTFNIAIDCYCCVNQVGFGLSLLGSIFKHGYMPNEVTLTTLLKGLIAQDKADDALSLFNKLQLQDIEPNLYTFNIAINCYCHMNRVGFGFSLLGSIFKHGYMPDGVTFTTLLNGLIAQDKADDALSLFDKLQLQDIEQNLYTFNIAINCYSHLNQVGFGFSLLGSIFKRGYMPDGVTFTTLLKGLVAQDKAAEALSLFDKLQLQHIELDLYIFSIAINCYCCVNQVAFGFSLLGSIFKRGYTPNVVIFNSLLNGLIAQDKAAEALSLFNKLLLQDIEIDLYTFNSAISRYCHMNRVGFGFSLLGSIFKRGYMPNVVTFSTLLNGLIAQDKVDEARNLFNKLLLQDIEPTLYAFNIAINCYSHVNRVGFGFSLLGCIFKHGYTPDVVTFNTLLDGLIRQDKADEAVELFEKVVRKGEIKPDVTMYGSLINRLCKMGNTGAAISFLRIAEEGGLKHDTMTYTMIIDRLCKDGLANDALNFLVEMNSKDIRANNVTYTSLIDGLCSLQARDDKGSGGVT